MHPREVPAVKIAFFNEFSFSIPPSIGESPFQDALNFQNLTLAPSPSPRTTTGNPDHGYPVQAPWGMLREIDGDHTAARRLKGLLEVACVSGARAKVWFILLHGTSGLSYNAVMRLPEHRLVYNEPRAHPLVHTTISLLHPSRHPPFPLATALINADPRASSQHDLGSPFAKHVQSISGLVQHFPPIALRTRREEVADEL